MSTASSPPSKAPYIVIGVIVIVLLIVWAVVLFYMYREKTGFFKPYTPQLSSGLVQAVPNSQFVPLTPRTKAKRDSMINAALQKAQSRQGLGARQTIVLPNFSVSA